ncbi:NAD-glutamate dehydrogenase domain-containing protein [Chiayiivirga sp.]|uniref:NAD-glutamate dehydrogenase n=1 Tax=Chiayiivirga sp. TaxID=2041042 RepID=UPI0025C3A4A9|nr:NAD-glutamate dehydrogenase domain-containing protein [Chiayiivirga sp.]
MSAQSASVSTLHDVSLEPILDALRAMVPAPRFKEASLFVEAFYGRMSAEEYRLRSPQAWAALARGFLDFVRERRPGKVAIRTFNPTVEEHGWESPHTVIQIANDDMPFLVDTVGMVLAQHDIAIHVLGHPVLKIRRDPGGNVLALGEGESESLMSLEIDRQTEPSDLQRIEDEIVAVLNDVRACVQDWQAMQLKLRAIAEELPGRDMPVSEAGRAEAQEFLRWAADDHFTFLGYREYEVVASDGDAMLRARAGTGLGLLKSDDRVGKPRSLRSLTATSLKDSGSVDALILTKTNARSTVHRPGYMDYIGVLTFDAQGRPNGEQRFIGLYTSSAYSRRPWDIPLVRERHEYVMAKSGLAVRSHSGKALRHILESLPRDELFQSGEEELFRTAMGILGLQERIRPKLFLRRDRYGRFYSALAYIPRDRFTSEIRRRIEAMLMEALNGQRIDTTIQVGESPLAQLHLIVRPKAGGAEVDSAELEVRLAQIVRNWHDELRDALVARHGEDKGLKLANRYGKALPTGYIEESTPEIAATDVERAAALRGPDDLRLSLYRPARGDAQALRFKLYRQGRDIPLSEVLPMLENMGLRLLTEHPYTMHVGEVSIHIQDFEVESRSGEVDVDAVRDSFENAFDRIWRGHAESDGFNRLILAAGLDWRQVAMLRGYAKYLLQTGVPFSQSYMEETLARYPLLARLLVEKFEAKFHPSTGQESQDEVRNGQLRFSTQVKRLISNDAAAETALGLLIDARAGSREVQMKAAESALHALLDRVASLDEDRILRSFMSVIRATLRTGFYQTRDGKPRDYISFKFDTGKLPDLPKPRPYREIFVYGPRVEGVHLRFGPVARGGLRWSDRREDFRTEVLGLVKAQMVKNTVIVPVGAKGGFFVKRPPIGGDRDAQLAEGIACYRLFINGLLDITDNLVDGNVVHPVDVVRHDADDPYLVVAADKGTATFSDIANAISLDHGFWMGDAFASGGSVGYDHKGMGITARGGWESVKRHFRAMGRDSQSEDFTCAGVGDMSGDVFGNGMLLSRHIRLVAAFDHRHIFLDPNPDSAKSYVERERLFKLPRSSWDDYDKGLISVGGGVWPRSSKAIPVSADVRRVLGIAANVEQMTPNELLSAILKAPVDLLWNGGIGTYVKASGETHADVGDRGNNAIRIDGNQMRARVMGEGGNLGMTQRGRIEAAQQGVLLNTDFIDNSAGVDTSDHEVNIKILLGAPVQRGELSMDARNALLASMTDEVGDLVLNDNYRQNQAISLMETMSVPRLGTFGHFIRTLEGQGLLDRGIEYLPSDAELLERKERGQGLTRPELSILLSYDKIVIFNQLLESDVPEDPYLSKELVRYFPNALQEKYAADMEQHRLRREIIATAVTNSLVNRMGATFLLRMQEDTGESPAQIAKAYSIAREVIEARDLWAGIDSLDLQVPESAQIQALLGIWGVLRNMSRWLLNRPGENLDIAAAVARYQPGIALLRGDLNDLLSSEDRTQFAEERARWLDLGFPQAMAEKLAALPFVSSALDVVEVALERKLEVKDVAKVYFGLGEALHLKWLLQKIDELPVEGRWSAHARGVMRDELQGQQSVLVAQVLAQGKGTPEQRVASWMGRDDSGLRFTQSMFADMRNQRGMDFPTVSVAVRRLAQLAAAGARG